MKRFQKGIILKIKFNIDSQTAKQIKTQRKNEEGPMDSIV